MPSSATYPRDWVPSLLQLLRQENSVLGPHYYRDVHFVEHASLDLESCRNRIPSADHLQSLLDTCFFAGIRQEEGRITSFRLAYFPRRLATNIAYASFAFETPLSFDPQQLTKLAPAFDPRSTYIAVDLSANGSLEIWGVVHFGSRLPPDVTGLGMPTCLNIVVWRPGVLTLRFANCVFSFRYSTGQGVLPAVASAQNDIERLTSPLLDFSTIKGIGVAMLEKGHGGAVFAIPASASTPDSVSFPKFKAAVPCDILKVRAEAIQRPDGATPANLAELQWAYDFIGSLSAVDGAVLLDSDLNVRGFGAFAKRTDHSSTLVDLQGKPYDCRNTGTRHASAVSFCDSVETGLALVVSQDGGTRLFVKQEKGKIAVVPDVHAYWHSI